MRVGGADLRSTAASVSHLPRARREVRRLRDAALVGQQPNMAGAALAEEGLHLRRKQGCRDLQGLFVADDLSLCEWEFEEETAAEA